MLKVAFVGGNAGTWSVESIKAVAGDGLPAVSRLAVLESADRFTELGGEWVLRGETSFERYVTTQASRRARTSTSRSRPRDRAGFCSSTGACTARLRAQRRIGAAQGTGVCAQSLLGCTCNVILTVAD
jgi:hypothetical protein